MVAVRFPLCLVVSVWIVTGCASVSLRRAETAAPNAARTAPAKPSPPAATAATAPASTPPAPASKPTAAPAAAKAAPAATKATPAPAPAADTAAEVEDTSPAPPLRLGLLAPLTGRYAAYGKAYLEGARAATGEHNTRSTPRVEIVPADCSPDPLPALLATRKLVEQPGVVALLGSVLNAPTLVAALEANCQGIPLVSNVATEDGIAGVGPWVFHAVPSRHAAARAAAELAVFQLRRFRAAVVYPDAGDGRALALAFGERFAELGGEVALSEPVADGTRDYSPVARRVAEATPDVLYAPCEVAEWMLLSPALAFHAVTAQIVGSEALADETLLRTHGADLEGAVLPAADAAAVAPPPSARGAARSQTEERLASAGYAAARRVLDAIARAPADDRDGVRAALDAAARAADPAQKPLASRFLVVRSGRVQPLR